MSIRNQDPHSNVPSISEPLRHQHSIYPTRWCVQCTATISSFYPQQCKESRRQEEVSCIHQQDTYIYIYMCVCDGKVPLRKPNKFGAYTYIIIYIYTHTSVCVCDCVYVCICKHIQTYFGSDSVGDRAGKEPVAPPSVAAAPWILASTIWRKCQEILYIDVFIVYIHIYIYSILLLIYI